MKIAGFSSIRGQQGAVRLLHSALRSGKLGSAYLFEGMPGIGKATTALALAQELNCEAPTAEGACGECDACRLIASGGHPDVTCIGPDGAFIKIAQVRQVTARGAFAPHQGRARLCLLDPADALNAEAANALLKTLEEPPARTHFVLVTATPERLPVTVRSRCQRVRFVPLSAEEIRTHLERAHGIAPTDARRIAGLAMGSLTAAVELAQGDTLGRRIELTERLERAIDESPSEMLEVAGALKEEKEEMPAVLALLRTWLRDASLLASGVSRQRLLWPERAERSQSLARLGPRTLARRGSLVAETELALRSNVSLQLGLERMLLAMKDG